MKLLSVYKDEIVATSTAAGWYEDTRTLGEECALLHSEVSEMFEAYRSWGFEDQTLAKCTHEHEETSFDGSYCHPNHVCKPEGVGSEAADVLIRLLDTCNRQEVDVDLLDAEFVPFGVPVDPEHWKNLSFGSAITELHRCIAVDIAGDDVYSMARALYPLLSSVCIAFELDLFEEVDRKIAFNKTRSYRHGGKLI